MFESFKIFRHQGKQYIPDPLSITLPDFFIGKPEISDIACKEGCSSCKDECPSNSIHFNPLRIDIGSCVFCSECVRVCEVEKIRFTNEHRMASNQRERLIIREGDKGKVEMSPDLIRKEITEFFSGSLKLRQVSAAGDNSAEWELNACSNVNFDMGRYGIEFVASPRHADGIVITGPISENMAEALQITYDAVPFPKIIILAGTDAISGGIFRGSLALDRTFISKYKVDLFVPGNPPHPLTFIHGVVELIRKRKKK